MSSKVIKPEPIQPKCLLCESHTNSKNPLRRGLCAKHYAQFKKMRGLIPAESVETFESRLIKDGKLLPDRQGQKGGENEFLTYARDLLPKDKQEIVARAEALAKELDKAKRKGKQ